MKKTAAIAALICGIIFFSCSKDQKVVKQLEGTWKVTSIKENGQAQPDSLYSGDSYTFEKCKVKKGPCDGTWTTDGKAVPFTYSISDKGTKFTMTMNIFGVSESETGDIVEHSDSKFVFKSNDGGDETETTLEK